MLTNFPETEFTATNFSACKTKKIPNSKLYIGHMFDRIKLLTCCQSPLCNGKKKKITFYPLSWQLQHPLARQTNLNHFSSLHFNLIQFDSVLLDSIQSELFNGAELGSVQFNSKSIQVNLIQPNSIPLNALKILLCRWIKPVTELLSCLESLSIARETAFV